MAITNDEKYASGTDEKNIDINRCESPFKIIMFTLRSLISNGNIIILISITEFICYTEYRYQLSALGAHLLVSVDASYHNQVKVGTGSYK